MNNTSSSPFMEKVSGAVSEALSEAIDRQSPAIAAVKKYQERFLSNNRIKSCKRVYISEEMFMLLNRLVAAVGADKASVGNYVTQIVREHMERYREPVNALYLTNTQPLF